MRSSVCRAAISPTNHTGPKLLKSSPTRIDRWRNPHIGFTINVRDENGQETSWEISASSVSHLDGSGTPFSVDAEYEERFTVSEDGKRLDYTILITDPATLTEPVLLDRFWLWVPGRQVELYDCTV